MSQILPLVPSISRYRFGTELGTDSFVVDVRWNGREGAWYIDLFDEFLVPVRMGTKLALGAPLPFGPGVLIPVDLSDAGRDAGYDDLGIRVRVYFFSYEEIAAIEAPVILPSVFRAPIDLGDGIGPASAVLAATLSNATLVATAKAYVKATLTKTLDNATLAATAQGMPWNSYWLDADYGITSTAFVDVLTSGAAQYGFPVLASGYYAWRYRIRYVTDAGQTMRTSWSGPTADEFAYLNYQGQQGSATSTLHARAYSSGTSGGTPPAGVVDVIEGGGYIKVNSGGGGTVVLRARVASGTLTIKEKSLILARRVG